MAFPNLSDIVTTTIENRSRKIADSVTKNNGLLTWIDKRGNTKTISGGSVIMQELSFAENGNAGFYSGYDLLPVATADVLSSAVFDIKQAACPVVISGLEELQNNSKEQMIDLIDARLQVAESTMANLLSGGVYSDGTGNGGKQITGLDAAVPVNPATGTYGGIDRVTWTFWRSQSTTMGAAATASTIQAAMNTMWASLVRGMDRPDLIVMDGFMWGVYMASLQAQQRFTDPQSATLGFPTIKYMSADCLLDGGIGGFAAAKTMYFLNTKFLMWRPHSERNLTALQPSKRYAINQDATVTVLGWAGNLTSSGAKFQGRLISP